MVQKLRALLFLLKVQDKTLLEVKLKVALKAQN